MKEIDELGGFELVNVWVFDVVLFKYMFFEFNKKLLIGVVFVFSMGFGVFLVIVMEIFNSGICLVEDVECKFG